MAAEKKSKNHITEDIAIVSVGACAAFPTQKKKSPCVILAYKVKGKENVFFVMTDFPTKDKLHDRDTLMSAIMKAEGVGNITYTTYNGAKKDIYFCRPALGKITDAVARDYTHNCYEDGISEVYSGAVKFYVENRDVLFDKCDKRTVIEISGANESNYTQGEYEYAVANAYNACLLGELFERDELHLETRDGKRVRIEVREDEGAIGYAKNTLCIKPVMYGDVIDSYITETFNYIDGDDVSCRAYKIIYSNRLKGYNLIKV